MLCIPVEWLPCCLMFPEAGIKLKMTWCGQLITCGKCVKTTTSRLARIGSVGLLTLGPWDPHKRWLKTIDDMAQCDSQWCSCIRSLSYFVQFFNYYFAVDILSRWYCDVATKIRARWCRISDYTSLIFKPYTQEELGSNFAFIKPSNVAGPSSYSVFEPGPFKVRVCLLAFCHQLPAGQLRSCELLVQILASVSGERIRLFDYVLEVVSFWQIGLGYLSMWNHYCQIFRRSRSWI